MVRMTRWIAVLVAGVVMAGSAVAAPKAELWQRWERHDPASTLEIDHRQFAVFLRDYLEVGPDGLNRVAYARVGAEGRAMLDAYISSLSTTPVGLLARPEQMAFWANLYNALTLDVILEHHPVDSIRDIDISPGFFADGPWGKKLVEVEGEAVSLDDIEHRILRPIWGDPRVHYAVNCASVGCPNLLPAPFTGATIDTMLDAGARAFVNHPRGARVTSGELRVSSIYSWFGDDFGGDDTGVIAHLRRYADPPLAAALSSITRISSHDYDWSLNDAR